MAPTKADGKETLQIVTAGSSSTGVSLQKGLHRRHEDSFRYSSIPIGGGATEPVSRKALDDTAKSSAKNPWAGDYNPEGLEIDGALVTRTGMCFPDNLLKWMKISFDWADQLTTAKMHDDMIQTIRENTGKRAHLERQWDGTIPVTNADGRWYTRMAPKDANFQFFIDTVKAHGTPYNSIMILAAAYLYGITLVLSGKKSMVFSLPKGNNNINTADVIMRASDHHSAMHLDLMWGSAASREKIDIQTLDKPSREDSNIFYCERQVPEEYESEDEQEVDEHVPQTTNDRNRIFLLLRSWRPFDDQLEIYNTATAQQLIDSIANVVETNSFSFTVAFGDNIIASGSLNNPDGWQCNRTLAQLGLQSGQTIFAIRAYDSSSQAIKRRRIEREQFVGNEGTASLDSLPSNNGHQNLASRKDWASQGDENDEDGFEAYPSGINNTVGNPGAETANFTPPGGARPRALIGTYGTGSTDTITAYPDVENPHHPEAADSGRSGSKLTEDPDLMNFSTMPSSGSRPSSSPAGTVGQATSAVPRERSPHSNSCSSNVWTGPLDIRNERDDRAAADFLRCMVTFHLAPCFGRFEMIDVSLPHGTSLEDTKKAIEMALSLDAEDLWIILEDRRQNLRDITRFPIHKGQVFLCGTYSDDPNIGQERVDLDVRSMIMGIPSLQLAYPMRCNVANLIDHIANRIRMATDGFALIHRRQALRHDISDMTPIALRNFVLDPRLEVVARIRPFDCGLLQELIDYNSLGASMLEPFTENPANVNISGTCFQRNFLKALWDVDRMIGNNVADLHSCVLIQMQRHARRYALQWDRTYPVQVDGCPSEWIIVQAAPETPFELFLDKVRSSATPYNHIMMLAAAEIQGVTLCLAGRYVLAFNTPDVTDDRQKLQIVMKTTIVGGLLHVTLMKGKAKIDISKCRLPTSDQANLFYFGKSDSNRAQCHSDSSAPDRTPRGTTQSGRVSLYMNWNLCYGADIAIRKAIHFSYLPNKEGNVELLFSACMDCGITNHRGNIGRYGVHVDVAKEGQESINVCLMCAFHHIQKLSEHSRQICYCKACHEITSLMCEYSKAEQNECVDAFPAATIFHQAEVCRIPEWDLIQTKRDGDDVRIRHVHRDWYLVPVDVIEDTGNVPDGPKKPWKLYTPGDLLAARIYMKRYRDALINLSTRNDSTDQSVVAAIARDVKKSRAFHKKGIDASPNPVYPGPFKRMEYSSALWYLVSTEEGTLQCSFCEAEFVDKSWLSWLAHCCSAGCIPAEVQKKWMDQCETSEVDMKKIINNARWDCSFKEMRRRPSTINGYECPECHQNLGTDSAFIHHVYDKHADDSQKARMEVYWSYEKLFSSGPKGKIQSQVRSTSYGEIITASTIKGGKDGWRCAICAQQINGQADPCETGYDAQPFFLHMAKCVKTDAIDKWTVQKTQGQHLKYIDLRPIMALAENPPPTRSSTRDTGDPWPETDGQRLFKAMDNYNTDAALNLGQVDYGIVRFDSDSSGAKATGNLQEEDLVEDQIMGPLSRNIAAYKWGSAGTSRERSHDVDSKSSVMERISVACSSSVGERMNQALITNLPSMLRAMYTIQYCISQPSHNDDMITDDVPGQYEASCFFGANKLRFYQPNMCAGVNSISTTGQCITVNDPKSGGFATRVPVKTAYCVKCMASATRYPDCQGKNCTMARILAGVPSIIDIMHNRICTNMSKGAPYNKLRQATSSGYHRHRNISFQGHFLPPGSDTTDEQSIRSAIEIMEKMHRQTATLVDHIQDILVDHDKQLAPPTEIIIFKNLEYHNNQTGDPANDRMASNPSRSTRDDIRTIRGPSIMTMEWSQSANRTSINIEYSSRSQTIHWEERIWPQHVGIRIAYAISLVITKVLVGVIPVGMVPMDAGALSRIFQLTNKDMMMTGFHGDPVMVDIPASYHSYGQSGFIISFDHNPNGGDLRSRKVPDGQSKLEWLQTQWKNRLDLASKPFELDISQDLLKWEGRLKGIARAQIKWASTPIGYLCPRGGSQMISSMLYIALIGHLDDLISPNSSTCGGSRAKLPTGNTSAKQPRRLTSLDTESFLTMSTIVSAVAELGHPSNLPVATAEHGGARLSDGSLEVWEDFSRSQGCVMKNDKIPSGADEPIPKQVSTIKSMPRIKLFHKNDIKSWADCVHRKVIRVMENGIWGRTARHVPMEFTAAVVRGLHASGTNVMEKSLKKISGPNHQSLVIMNGDGADPSWKKATQNHQSPGYKHSISQEKIECGNHMVMTVLMTRHPRLWLISLLTQSTYDINVLRKYIGEGMDSGELVFAFGKGNTDPVKTLEMLNGHIEYNGCVYEGALHLMIVMLRSWANEDIFPEDTTYIVKLEDLILTPERILDVIRSSITWCNESTEAQLGVLDSAGKSHRSTNNRSRPELAQALQDPHLFHKDVPDGSKPDIVINDFLDLGISAATGYDRTLLPTWNITEVQRLEINKVAQRTLETEGPTRIYVRETSQSSAKDEEDRKARLTQSIKDAVGITDMHFPALSNKWDHVNKVRTLGLPKTTSTDSIGLSSSGGIHPMLLLQTEDRWVKIGQGLGMTAFLRKRTTKIKDSSRITVVLPGYSSKGWVPDEKFWDEIRRSPLSDTFLVITNGVSGHHHKAPFWGATNTKMDIDSSFLANQSDTQESQEYISKLGNQNRGVAHQILMGRNTVNQSGNQWLRAREKLGLPSLLIHEVPANPAKLVFIRNWILRCAATLGPTAQVIGMGSSMGTSTWAQIMEAVGPKITGLIDGQCATAHVKKIILQAAVATQAQWDSMIINRQTRVTIIQHPDDSLCPIDTISMQKVIHSCPHMEMVIVQAASRSANPILFGQSRHAYQSIAYSFMETMTMDERAPERLTVTLNGKQTGHRGSSNIGLKCWTCSGVMAIVARGLSRTFGKHLTSMGKKYGEKISESNEQDKAKLTHEIRKAVETLKMDNASNLPMSQVAAAALRMMTDPAKIQLLAQESWVSTDQAYRGLGARTRQTCKTLETQLSHNMGYYGILRWTALLIDSVDNDREEEGIKAVIALVTTVSKEEWPVIPIILVKIWKGAITGLHEPKLGNDIYHEGQQILWRTPRKSNIIITIQERVGIKGSEVIILVESEDDDQSMAHFPLDADDKAKTGKLPTTALHLRKGESLCSCGSTIESKSQHCSNCWMHRKPTDCISDGKGGHQEHKRSIQSGDVVIIREEQTGVTQAMMVMDTSRNYKTINNFRAITATMPISTEGTLLSPLDKQKTCDEPKNGCPCTIKNVDIWVGTWPAREHASIEESQHCGGLGTKVHPD